MTRRTLATIALTFGIALTTATAAWSFTFPHQVFQLPSGTFKTMEPSPPPPPPIGIGSGVSYRGRVDSVHLFASDFTGTYQAPQCSAVIVTDDQKTISVSTDANTNKPNVQSFHNAVACDALQAAFSEGWKVSVTGIVTAMGASDPSSIVMAHIQTGPESPEGPSTMTTASGLNLYSCPYPTCSPEGTIASFTTDLQSPERLCQATLKTTPASDGTSQLATVNVASTKLIPDNDPGEWQFISLFNGKQSLCDGFLRSLTDGRPVTVYFKVSGSGFDVTTMDRTAGN